MKKLKAFLFIILICVSMSFTSFAHSGRTDSNGGHHDYKNKSGLGSYHYHCGGNPPHLHPNGVCPYSGGLSDSNNSNDSSSFTPETPSIKVNNAPQTLGIGNSLTLEYTFTNTLRDTREITSSNEQVVKITKEDTLEAISEGEATITVKTNSAETSFIVKVKPIMATSIEISNIVDKLQLDTEFQFEYSIKPSNTTDKTVTWESSNSDIAVVDAESGKVKTKAVGDVIITCTTSNGVKKSIPINIYEVFPKSIETNLDKNNVDEINLESTKTYQIFTTILPENANNKTYRIYVENEKLAQMLDAHNIYGFSDGDTNVVIRTHNGITKTIPLHIYHIPTSNVKLDYSSIEYILSTSNLTVVDTNQVLDIDYKITPQDATFKKVIWQSSNDDIINPNDNKLEVIGTGSVELTAYTYDGQSEKISLYVIDFSSVLALFIICFGSCICYAIIWYKYKYKQ